MGNQPFDCKKGHSITVFQACQRDISVTLYIFDAYRVIAVFPDWNWHYFPDTVLSPRSTSMESF